MIEEKLVDHKQKIKRQRIKIYFGESAKEIIAKEGIESVSVRKVADAAGYSYATLYNYFEDINELLWDVKQGMIDDIIETMKKKMSNISLDINGVKILFRIYITYYFENPNIFKFFYFHKLIKPRKKLNDTAVEPDFNEMMRATFKSFVLEGRLSAMDLEVVGKTCIYAVHGMLTLFFTGNGDLTEESIFEELNKIIDYLLGEG